MVDQLRTLGALMHRDLLIFASQLKDRAINSVLWIAMTTWVTYNIMPEMGLVHMGVFMAITNVAGAGIWEIGENVSKFVADLEGERTISYYLTLPISQNMIFIKMALVNALQVLILALIMLPLSLMIVWQELDGSKVLWGQAIVLFILIHVLYGFLSLYLSCKVHSMDKLSNLYMRYIFPLWYFGASNFTWDAMLKVSPALAYLNLLNPMTYCMEGLRRVTLGTQGSLSFEICFFVVCLFTIFFGFLGIKSLKQKLDCI